MPISRENAARYPKNWKTEIVPQIRARSGNQCECMGECGLIHVRSRTGGQIDIMPGQMKAVSLNRRPIRCEAVNGEPHPVTNSKVVLTVGHLNHEPEDCRPEVLKHWCQRCHLRYDRDHHQANARRTRERKSPQARLDV